MSKQSVEPLYAQAERAVDYRFVGTLSARFIDDLLAQTHTRSNWIRSLSLEADYVESGSCAKLVNILLQCTALESVCISIRKNVWIDWQVGRMISACRMLRSLQIQRLPTTHEPELHWRKLRTEPSRSIFDCHEAKLISREQQLAPRDLSRDALKSIADALKNNHRLLELKLPWDAVEQDDVAAIRDATSISRKVLENRRRSAALQQILNFRRAYAAQRDARILCVSAAEGRPLELAKRLRLGALAGGLKKKKNGMTALEAAAAGGHTECVQQILKFMEREH